MNRRGFLQELVGFPIKSTAVAASLFLPSKEIVSQEPNICSPAAHIAKLIRLKVEYTNDIIRNKGSFEFFSLDMFKEKIENIIRGENSKLEVLRNNIRVDHNYFITPRSILGIKLTSINTKTEEIIEEYWISFYISNKSMDFDLRTYSPSVTFKLV